MGTQDEEKHRETGNIGYTRRRKTQRNWQLGTQDEEKQKHNTICVGHHYVQTDTNLRKIKDMSPSTNKWG